MEWLWLLSAVMCGVGLCAALYFYRRGQKFYYNVDKMLDEILDNREIEQTDLAEGQVSALAGKLKRIQEKVELEVGEAQKEKEQVKSLISNMSH